MPDIIVKQQPASNLTIQSNSTQLLIRQAAANNITVATTGNSYVLPAATNSTLGGIIVGSNLTIANGVLSATSAGGGVTAFNNRTGNVTLTANDVTAVANGIYIVDSIIGNIPTFEGPRLLYGQYQTRGQAPAYPYVSGSLGIGSMAIVGVVNSSDPCNIEFSPGDIFNVMRFRAYDKTIVLNSDGFSVETGTANWTWSANSILTQGRGDARYQPVGSYLTSSNLTWSNITGKPTFATVATSGSYNDLANTPNLSLYYLASNPSGFITAACLTYSNITGTPNLSLYLTTANAASTYLPSANFSFSNLTGKPTTLAGYGITDGLTTANAAATYLPSANFTYANIGGTIPTATNTTLGAVKVGSNLTIANGVLSATSSGGFQNGDTLNGGTY